VSKIERRIVETGDVGDRFSHLGRDYIHRDPMARRTSSGHTQAGLQPRRVTDPAWFEIEDKNPASGHRTLTLRV